MSHRFACANGHRWTVVVENSELPPGWLTPCPVCGAEAETPPPVLTAEMAAPLTQLDSAALRHTHWPQDGDPAQPLTPPDPASQLSTRSPESSGDAPPTHSDAPGGPDYQLLETLGRGAMGVVYKALDRRLQRVVALKMILSGKHAGRDELTRFRLEAKSIASIAHPNIVQIHDVGVLDGKPFLSLEYCPGGTLAHQLRGKPLAARDAALLIEQLARGMQAAHERNILHRDLKPANILLQRKPDAPPPGPGDGEGDAGLQPGFRLADFVPKVTDFGLAKKLDEANRTLSGAVLGTPHYMPPEQAGGRTGDIGPASDVYSLGAILYECLTGRPPFLAASSADTLLQVMSEDPVPVRRLQSKTPRDLETICLKCLEKEPHKRYRTAAALADDLHRFLAGEPVLARPTGALERAAKWVRRRPAHAALLAAVAVLLSTMTVGVWVAVYTVNNARLDERNAKREAEARGEANRLLAEKEEEARKNAQDAAASEAEARKKAEVDAARARAVANMLAAIFQAPDPLGLNGLGAYIPKKTGENLNVRELLARGVKTVEKDAKGQPELLAMLFDAFGNAHRSLGLYEEAERLLTRGLELRRDLYGDDHLDTAASLHNVGWLYHDRGDYDRALDCYQRALAVRVKHLPADDPQVLDSRFNIAWLRAEMGDSDQAAREFKEIIGLRIHKYGEDHRTVAIARIGLAASLVEGGEYAQALIPTQQAMKTFIELEGDENLAQAVGKFQTALFQREVLHNRASAAKLLRESRELAERAMGTKNHIYIAVIIFEQGFTAGREDLASAESYFLECLEIVEAQVGLAHPRSTLLVGSLSAVLALRGKPDEGVKLFERQLAAMQQRFGDKHRYTAKVRTNFGTFLIQRQHFERAEQELQAAAAIYRDSKSAPVWERSLCFHQLGVALLRRKQPAAAAEAFSDVLALPADEKRLGHPARRAASFALLAWSRMEQGQTKGVEELIEQSDAAYRALSLSERDGYADFLVTAFRYYRERNELAKAAGYVHERRKLAAKAKNGEALVDVARQYMQCAALAEGTERREYEAAALETLEQAVERGGYRNSAAVKDDEAFKPLRERAEFLRLLQTMEAHGK
jgi:tetratricopeptide (TPR) repeat protein